MIKKKSIVLNGVNDKSQRAVLTMECNGEMTSGRLRLYNFGNEPKGIISLGINTGGEIIKAGLTHSSGMLFTFISGMKDIPNNFSCAVVNFVGGQSSPILYGSSEGYVDKEKIFSSVLSSLSESKTADDVENVLDQYVVDYDDEEKEHIDCAITAAMAENGSGSDNDDCNSCKPNCENCKYKAYYLQHIKPMSENTEKTDRQQENLFYNQLKAQIDDLFANNQSEEYLEQLMPNSKWVKVNLGDSEDYYVLGLIYEDDELKYICYGVPGVYQKIPPRELSGYPVWFALDPNKPESFGYWLSYQDANTGDSVKAVVV
mgnify:CR=1 FL=1